MTKSEAFASDFVDSLERHESGAFWFMNKNKETKKQRASSTNRNQTKCRLICVKGGECLKGAAFVGDTDAKVLMTHVMSRYKSEFMRISYVYLADHELAKIAVSNAFFIMARRLNQYPGQTEEKVWALRHLLTELRRLNIMKSMGLRPFIRKRRR